MTANQNSRRSEDAPQLDTSMELQNKLRDWINTQGYPMEMRVARIAERCGLRVSQGFHYYDVESQTHREIDVMASRHVDLELPAARLTVRVVLEVKASVVNPKPWIVLASEHSHMNPIAAVAQRYLTDYGSSWWSKNASRDPLIQQLRMFALDDQPGYSLVQANFNRKESREDRAFAAMMQLTKAATGICDWMDMPPVDGTIGLVLPMLVIEGPLYRCTMAGDGELVLEEVDSVTLLWKNRSSLAKPPTTIIRVTTEAGLSGCLADIQRGIPVLQSAFRSWISLVLSDPKAADIII